MPNGEDKALQYDETKRIIADNITRLIKTSLNAKSESEAAGMIGMTPQQLNKYTSGKQMPKIHILCHLADVFGVSVDELVGHAKQSSDEYTTAGEVVDAIEKIMQSVHSNYHATVCDEPSPIDLSELNIHIHNRAIAEYFSDSKQLQEILSKNPGMEKFRGNWFAEIHKKADAVKLSPPKRLTESEKSEILKEISEFEKGE